MRILDSGIEFLVMDEWMDGCGRIFRDLTVQRKFLFFFFRAKFCVATRLMKFIFSLQKVSLDASNTWKLQQVRIYKESFPEELVR